MIKHIQIHKNIKTLIVILLTSLLSSCEEFDLKSTSDLSDEEIATGLKSALNVGTDTAVKILNSPDGYYKDNLVKILLPDEAAIIVNNIALIPGGNLLIEETITAINRSAEDAAKEASPIFLNAINSITFADAKVILSGANDAATIYLKSNTKDALFNVFQPKINLSLSKEFLPGISAQSSYASLVSKYNVVANSSLGLLKPISGNSLSAHTTEKALNGIFLKVAFEEGRIRTNINHRVNDILRKVFEKK